MLGCDEHGEHLEGGGRGGRVPDQRGAAQSIRAGEPVPSRSASSAACSASPVTRRDEPDVPGRALRPCPAPGAGQGPSGSPRRPGARRTPSRRLRPGRPVRRPRRQLAGSAQHRCPLTEDRGVRTVTAVVAKPRPRCGVLLGAAAEQRAGAAARLQQRAARSSAREVAALPPAMVALAPLSPCQIAHWPAAQFITVLGNRAGSTATSPSIELRVKSIVERTLPDRLQQRGRWSCRCLAGGLLRSGQLADRRHLSAARPGSIEPAPSRRGRSGHRSPVPAGCVRRACWGSAAEAGAGTPARSPVRNASAPNREWRDRRPTADDGVRDSHAAPLFYRPRMTTALLPPKASPLSARSADPRPTVVGHAVEVGFRIGSRPWSRSVG